jgi:hypothetical protein
MNTTTHEVHYSDYQRQMAWINANDWQIEKRPTRRYLMRQGVAKALIALANILAPRTAAPERQTG